MGNFGKTVIGLNLKHHLKAVIMSVLSALMLFMPYVKLENRSLSLLGLLSEIAGRGEFFTVYIIPVLAMVFALVSVILAAVSIFKTNKPLFMIWQASQILSTVLPDC